MEIVLLSFIIDIWKTNPLFIVAGSITLQDLGLTHPGFKILPVTKPVIESKTCYTNTTVSERIDSREIWVEVETTKEEVAGILEEMALAGNGFTGVLYEPDEDHPAQIFYQALGIPGYSETNYDDEFWADSPESVHFEARRDVWKASRQAPVQ